MSIKTILNVDSKRLGEVFKKYGEMPNKADMNNIIFYLERGFFAQLIYNFPEDLMAKVIKYFEETEEYEICSKIVKTVDLHNKQNGTNIKSALEEC